MKALFSSRLLYLFIFLSCLGLLSYAYYLQHVEYLDPCPLCIFQRIAFVSMGLVALVAAIHGPQRFGAWIYTVLIGIGGLVGIGIAGRHVWMQGLPPDEVPACGPGLDYMLDQFPLAETLKMVFTGSGSCATIDWQFLGFSMPFWSLVWFVLLLFVALIAVFRSRRAA
jgi:disulfide bond formation protein DsbB